MRLLDIAMGTHLLLAAATNRSYSTAKVYNMYTSMV